MNKKFKNEKALVLTSGGQDSATCIFWALKNFKKIYAVSFNYGQKHAKEIKKALNLCKRFNIDHKIINIEFLKDIVISNLFKNTSSDYNKGHKLNKNVPSSFVPYRNMIFLTLASAWASTIKIRHIVIGVCETDYSGYADCRNVFIKSIQKTLNLSTDFKEKIILHVPLMKLTKAEEFKLAVKLGCLDTIINETLTCYNGIEKMNDFGLGCGKCPACKLRKKGYIEFIEKKKQ